MATKVRYDQNSMTSVAQMVIHYNPHFRDASIGTILDSIQHVINRIARNDLIYSGTMGFIVVSTEKEEVGDDVIFDLEFYFDARMCSHNPSSSNYVTQEITAYSIGE